MSEASPLPANRPWVRLGRSVLRLKPARRLFDRVRDRFELPAAARAERNRDARGLTACEDPGLDRVIAGGIEWIGHAQDHSTTADGGVARHYSLVSGWGPSYPETTGYIVPTLLHYAERSGEAPPRERARRMLDWFVKIQLPGGGFQGGTIDAEPVVPVTFNTGQILMGLAAGVRAFDDYREQTIAAADWLVATMDDDGCWRKHPTPFARAGEKAYETHVAWSLFEADRVIPGRDYGVAGLRNIAWALTHQQSNGWFARCCLTDPTQPLTHTIGYVLRGVIEGYLFGRDAALLQAAQRTADGILGAFRPDGFLPGRLNSSWEGTVPWVCLTGTAQIAHCWLLLYRETGDTRYRDAAFAALRYVRRTVRVSGPPEIRGAVKGSFPVSGGYGRYEYLNWACKFLIDACMLEQEIRSAGAVEAVAATVP